jgi:hypothetical protein
MPIRCPHCSRSFLTEKISPRHIANCPNWPRTLTEPCLCGFQAVSDNKLKAHKRECEVWLSRDKKEVKLTRMQGTMLEKYGVPNPMQSKEIRKKASETNRTRYGAENPFSKDSSLFQKVQASLEGKRPVLRGEANPFARPEVQEKIRASMREKYGYEHVQQVPDIRARTTATCEERYGGVLMSSPALAEKARETNIALYGDAFPQRTEAVKNKIQETNLLRYGVPWTSMDPETRRKQLETHHERWGSHYFASDEGKAQIRSVMLERFGVEFPGAIEGHWDRLVETFKERYGVEHPLQLAEFLDKRRDTVLEKYGVEHVLQNTEIRERMVATKMEKYGNPWGPSPIDGPNGLERKVLALSPEGSLLFTGDFSFWRWLPKLGHHKNPDFIVPGPDPENPKKGVTRVVEAFGDYFHSKMFTGRAPFEHEGELIDAYREVGIECLVLWESEVLGYPEQTRARLLEFLQYSSYVSESANP